MKISGIYKITHLYNGMFYIGSSNDIHQRWNEHRSLLNRRLHSNKKLTHSWHKYGIDLFKFEIIEEVNDDKLIEIEQKYLNDLRPFDRKIGYNLNPIAGGGDVFGLMTSKEQEEFKRKCTKWGSENGMFGKSHTNDTRLKQKDKAKGRFSLPWFQHRYGVDIGSQKYNDRCLFLKNRKIIPKIKK